MKLDSEFTELLKRDRRYKLESYRFVNDSLRFAIKRLDKEKPNLSEELFQNADQHITGQELCYAAVDFALEQYGMMARSVLYDLGIKKTDDIGNIVFNLLEIGQMKKTEEDKIEDFNDLFDIGGELDRGFRFVK